MVFQLDSLSSKLSDLTLKLIAAVVILLIGLVIGRFLGNLTKKILHELELDKLLKEQTRFKIPLEQFLGSVVKFVVYLLFIILALNQLGLETAILNIILTIILVVLVAFMILAVKDFIPNFVAGIILHQKRNIKAGERIEVNDIEGEVINVTLIETKIRTKSGEIVYIPNSVLTKNVVIKKK
jgi:small conductance mechanosensitive channel